MMSVWINNSKKSKEHCKHEVTDQEKYRKRANRRKWQDIEYHVQYNAGVSHKDVKIYCDKNQLPTLPFCGPHPKPHGARGLIKHQHLCFDTKLGHVICEICRTPCAYVACT